MTRRLLAFLLMVAVGLLCGYYVQLILNTNKYVGLDDIKELQHQKDEMTLVVSQMRMNLDDVNKKIATLQGDLKNEQQVDTLKSEIEHYANLSGFKAVYGEGVIVTIDDSSNPMNPYQTPEDLIVHDTNLIYIADELRRAGAEAVSINGTRIIFGLSEIICSGPTIRINQIQHSPPFIIRAIGDRYTLQKAMVEADSYTNTLKQFGLDVEVNTKVYMKIGSYVGRDWFNYAKVRK